MKIVAYYRVSTQRQGRSGFGLEAQAQTVAAKAAQIGAEARIVETFTEIESGRRCDRPVLAQAVALAKVLRATLIVAKLDRLSRDVRFLLTLVDSGVQVSFGDLPDLGSDPVTGRLILTVMASVAEFEARRIGQRIREAAAARKARGVVLDYSHCARNLTREDRLKGSRLARVVNLRLAQQYRDTMRPVVAALAAGKTRRQTADVLNSGGYRTRRNRLWTLATVSAILSHRYMPKP